MTFVLALLAALHLNVFAASSLAEVFPRVDPTARYQFAGSDQLAFQIGQGAPADVFAAASPKYPDDLFARGLCSRPVVFATNTVVLIVPRANPARIRSVQDLTRDGIRLVIGAQGVPIGDYTRRLLANLGLGSALANVVSEETDVKLVVAKVALGEADAGFVYRTDALADTSDLHELQLPARARPKIAYELAVLKSTKHLQAANAFVVRVLSARGRRALRRAGFGLP
jgi:molybdate transport system substrate-binding protein